MRNPVRASLRRLLRTNASPATKNLTCFGMGKKSPARPSGATNWVCSYKARCNLRLYRNQKSAVSSRSVRLGKRPCARSGARNSELNGSNLSRMILCGNAPMNWSGPGFHWRFTTANVDLLTCPLTAQMACGDLLALFVMGLHSSRLPVVLVRVVAPLWDQGHAQVLGRRDAGTKSSCFRCTY